MKNSSSASHNNSFFFFLSGTKNFLFDVLLGTGLVLAFAILGFLAREFALDLQTSFFLF